MCTPIRLYRQRSLGSCCILQDLGIFHSCRVIKLELEQNLQGELKSLILAPLKLLEAFDPVDEHCVLKPGLARTLILAGIALPPRSIYRSIRWGM